MKPRHHKRFPRQTYQSRSREKYENPFMQRSYYERSRFQRSASEAILPSYNLPKALGTTQPIPEEQDTKNQQFVAYIRGLFPDVSLSDILLLTEGMQVIEIQTTLKRYKFSNDPYEMKKCSDVLVTFVGEDDAFRFKEAYEGKFIDGKSRLTVEVSIRRNPILF